jgi:tol-pal system protein YbgF
MIPFLSRSAFALLLLALPAVASAQEREAPAREPGRLEQFGRDVTGAFGSIFGQGNQQANQPASSGPSSTSPQMAQMGPTDMVVRIDQLERQIRSLTGAIEQLQFRNQQLEQQIRRLEDESGRTQGTPRGAVPRTPPAAAVVPAPPAPAPPVPGRRNDAFDPAQNPNAPGAPRPLGSPGGRSDAGDPVRRPMTGAVASAVPGGDAIGTVIMSEENPVGVPGGREPGEPLDLTGRSGAPRASEPVRSNPIPGQQSATLPPAQTPRDEFDLAYGYVLRKDYALAEEGLRGFLKKYPSDRLAGDAQFWLGESMFQRQKFRDAADAFVAMAKKYEGNSKAPDALLRLAQSLAALNEKELACATFGEVTRKYPRASASVKQSVEREQKRVRC